MAVKKDVPYMSVTWFPKYLTGRNSCLWSLWYRSNYKEYSKVPSNFDSAKWNVDHAEFLDKIEQEYKQKYKHVLREGQNNFKYKGKSGAIVAGKPDLVGVSAEEVCICDVKTGQRQDEHWAQMVMYLFMYPKCFPQLFHGGATLKGELVYKDGKQEVYPEDFNDSFRERLTKLLQLVGQEAPTKVASKYECADCVISSEDCDERIDKEELENRQMEYGDF